MYAVCPQVSLHALLTHFYQYGLKMDVTVQNPQPKLYHF